MEILSVQCILLSILGMTIHVIMKVIARKEKMNNKLSFKVFVNDPMNWLRIILAVASTISLLLMSEDISEMMGVVLKDGAPAKTVFAFLAGYMNHSMIRNFLKIVKIG